MNFEVREESSLTASGYDGIILVSSSIEGVAESFEPLVTPIKTQLNIDNAAAKECTCVPVNIPAGRLIYSPTGPVTRDIDDVRRFSDAAVKGVKRALKAGVTSPLLAVVPCSEFPECELVTLLGALYALYVPLEIREDSTRKAKKVDKLGFIGKKKMVELAKILESGRIVARDIGGSDPERMAAPKVEEYVRTNFSNSEVSIEVISNEEELEKKYPLFAAVNRCAKGVDRHKGRVVYLSYTGQGPIQRTYCLVGKGVTYDTGGADIKAGGIMASMHRDKCGSAAVAGFMEVVKQLKPPNVKILAAMAMVRNSVGSNCYVSDELITSRAGVRIRIGNTDAEGRMAMADVLCHLKEKALKEVDPHLMTIATLTGHVVRAYGEGYSAIMDNGPAKMARFSYKIQEGGEDIADPFEISSIRREDYEVHEGKSEYEDVLQCNNKPTTQTDRGHMTPAAFLIMASGLDKHGKDSNQPLKYSHIDIAASSGPFPGIPTGAPILALTKTLFPASF